MNDFSLNVHNQVDSYRQFLAALCGTRPSFTHIDFHRLETKPKNAFLLRHDVDHSLEKALLMAHIEAELHIKASYYLLPTGAYGESTNYYGSIQGNDLRHNSQLFEVARELVELGHEVGLHNDFVQLSDRLDKPIEVLIRQEMKAFAENGVFISGTASHGSRFARNRHFVNYEIFSDRPNTSARQKLVRLSLGREMTLPTCTMQALGLEYEAYGIRPDIRVSDVGGRLMFATNPNTEGPKEFNFLKGVTGAFATPLAGAVVLLVHPEHWVAFDSTPSSQNDASHTAPRPTSKHPLTMNDISFQRKDGRKFRIAARGDCVSRRAVSLNQQLFPDGYHLIVNEKATNLQFAEALEGRPCSFGLSCDYVNHADMPGSLGKYFSCQFDRSILDCKDLDLLVMDTYSDMNFQMWTHKRDKWSMWIHPKYSDMQKVERDFDKTGLCSFEEAIAHTVKVIKHVRKNNPELPVLFLYQPVEFYRKLSERSMFYRLPEAVAAILPKVYASDILGTADLGTADMNSCGVGQTLHFDGSTYSRMMESAWRKGLSKHFSLICESPTVPSQGDAPPSQLADLDITSPPNAVVSYGGMRPMCRDSCKHATESAVKTFAEYIVHPEQGEPATTKKRFVPMTIDIDSFERQSFTNYLKQFSKGFQLREIKRAIKSGLYCKPFAYKLHIPDLHEINHSKSQRSGGEMRGSYLRSIEEMGGAPDRKYAVVPPTCNNHWSVSFGAFEKREGYMQGSVITNEKLLAYISLRRTGDIVLYSQILGHADFLQKGIMMFLHMAVRDWLCEKGNPAAQQLKYLMYGGAANGGQALYSWKRKAGFKPVQLIGFTTDKKMSTWTAELQCGQ